MKTPNPSLLLGRCRHFATLARFAALLLGVGLALPAWSALTVNAANDTVTDSTTGLVWDQCAQGLSGASCTTGTATTFTWGAALTTASTANTAVYKGFSDWRLPNKNELESIVKIDSFNPAIDSAAFPATPNSFFWTSTAYAPNPNVAWVVYFYYGVIGANFKTSSGYVRLVRSGQSFASFDAFFPSIPTAPTATSGNTTANVTFVAPADNGSAITGYNLQMATTAAGVYSDAATGCAPATLNTSTATTCTATGLSNGTSYFFRLLAINANGSSAYSPASLTVVPATLPATPAAPTASAGNTTASVTFVAPANNGSAITGYTVVSSPAGGVDSNAGSTGLTHSMTGLTNGMAYTFTVTATNGVGTSAYSPASLAVVPATLPATPAAPTASAGNTTASVTFVAPANNGSAITGYTVVSSPAGGVDSNAGSTGLTHSMTGLTNGTAYTFTVTATNGVGTSSASAASSPSVTPLGEPATPAAPTASAGNTTASVTFVAPANNGSAITGYTVVSNPAGGTDSNAGTTGLTHSITGLTNGTAYTFTVTATNGVGTSSASAASSSVTPAVPVAPTPDPTPAIPLLPVSITGIGFGALPSILNMGAGEGPSFLSQVVVLLSNALGNSLSLVQQNTNGTVTLSGFNGGNLAFMPHSFQSVDVRTNGIYPVGNGQYQVVVNGRSITIAPALVRLDQLIALFPGMSASVADTGVITASLNGTTYVVQPGVAVQLDPATGTARLVLGADGLYRFTDAQGNTQVVYPAFAAPAILRNVLQSIDFAATMNIELDATATVLLGGVRYTLVPDLTLGGIAAEQVGKTYWPDGLSRYRMWVNFGVSQGLTVKPK